MLKRYFLHGVEERQGQYAFSWKMVASVDKRFRGKKTDLFPLRILWYDNVHCKLPRFKLLYSSSSTVLTADSSF